MNCSVGETVLSIFDFYTFIFRTTFVDLCWGVAWGRYSLIWPIRGCAAGQGMDFGLSVLNRVCDSVRVCPKQGI